jgi:hypothetical protein
MPGLDPGIHEHRADQRATALPISPPLMLVIFRPHRISSDRKDDDQRDEQQRQYGIHRRVLLCV